MDQPIEFRKIYGKLIIDTIEKKEIYSNALIISFSGNKKVTKERILMMKNVKRPKNLEKVLSIVVSMFIVLLGSIAVFAYDGVEIVLWESRKVKDHKDSILTEGVFIQNDKVMEKVNWNFQEIKNTSRQFIDETGDIYEVDRISEELYSSEKACNHSYISGTLSEHIMSADRSCIHIINKASKCKICNNILTNGSYEEHKYAECPH